MASLSAVCLFAAQPSGSSSGGFLLGAPGVVTGSIVQTRAPFKVTKDLGKFYKYIFRGMETKGASNSGATNGGHLNLFVGVNDVDLKSVGFSHERAFNASAVNSFPLASPVTYNQQNIIVHWKGTGSAHSPNGYFIITGEGIRDPKEPKGTLNVDSFALAGTTFKITWAVTRDY